MGLVDILKAILDQVKKLVAFCEQKVKEDQEALQLANQIEEVLDEWEQFIKSYSKS